MKSILMYSEKRVFDFLSKGKIKSQLDSDTITGLEAGVLRLDDFVLYNRKELKASGNTSGTIQLFQGGDTEEQGIRNFNNRKLPKYNHMIVAGVKIGVIGSNSSADPAHVANYTSQRSSFPAALANGKLTVSQNDSPLIELEVFQATTQGAALSSVGEEDIFPLGQLRLLKADVPFDWELKFAQDETLLSANTNFHLEVALVGWKTRLQ